ncbi:periplasmic binding protein and sugar binding domain of the LacI family protein [Peptoanaerobacter stomatis]|uniref:Periplasmic binding protein and sugar binding domain of the LacI family protein n=1 Tax=Peptoanaerobacter stomatis TaxID=796937 RepID=J4WDK9_9FIRM|nr:LacI family DNA-binding transcriptional regulator [Peptoanaerobacter stomatis]EJU23506.1 periplasmic binding protein and sugar binding domain of the LacI family protein [Peptoanaerobacter stomatis]NWO24545.1 LacI family DNA-binding transcriptional regulator [Peptostreptococcaceae bacterium oral taxon 081]
MANINDISKLAGVSKSTVSRYLNNGSISKNTAKKIKKVVDELNYIPNTFAQSLKATNSNSIATIIPNFIGFSKNISLNSIDAFLKTKSYKLFISNSNDNMKEEIKLIYSIANQKVDGIILFASQVTDEHYRAINDVKIPFIVIGQELDGIHCIVHNDYKAGKLIGEYILNSGHKNISYFGVGDYDKSIKSRYLGLMSVLEKDKTIKVKYHTVGFDVYSAYNMLINTYKKNKSTYYVAATDNIAFGIIKGLKKLNLDIPKDVSVSGFGDYDMSMIFNPALTTISFPYSDIGTISAKMLLDMINGIDIPKKMVLDCELKIRNSTRRLCT